ncbi:hypothetical protein BDZ97DRAFT_1760086 [Flammula alnicola]|nr:hypothetical protein BDZ97DRAFT_1760086 [Flammula alnicola]
MSLKTIGTHRKFSMATRTSFFLPSVTACPTQTSRSFLTVYRCDTGMANAIYTTFLLSIISHLVIPSLSIATSLLHITLSFGLLGILHERYLPETKAGNADPVYAKGGSDTVHNVDQRRNAKYNGSGSLNWDVVLILQYEVIGIYLSRVPCSILEAYPCTHTSANG